jgi:hypothetical protein
LGQIVGGLVVCVIDAERRSPGIGGFANALLSNESEPGLK